MDCQVPKISFLKISFPKFFSPGYNTFGTKGIFPSFQKTLLFPKLLSSPIKSFLYSFKANLPKRAPKKRSHLCQSIPVNLLFQLKIIKLIPIELGKIRFLGLLSCSFFLTRSFFFPNLPN